MKFEDYLAKLVESKYQYVAENEQLAEAEDKEESKKEDDKKSSKKDAVCMHASVFMRVLELVREDVEDDDVLHHLAEKIFEIANDKEGEPITMDDYKDIEKAVTEQSDDDDEDEKDSSKDQEDEDLDESAKKQCDDCDELEEKKCDCNCDDKKSVEECDGQCTEDDKKIEECDGKCTKDEECEEDCKK